ncbi:hypothetical protein AN639_06575 [Candidatus Epulonipiscium fishelsonii]|nr:hypothetical protein AN639_06575 [Epulopiscium sp. SCG-B05WGA-EpuloA1]
MDALVILGNSSYVKLVLKDDGFKDVLSKTWRLEIVVELKAEMQDDLLDITEQILTATPDVVIFFGRGTKRLCLGAKPICKTSETNIVIMWGRT